MLINRVAGWCGKAVRAGRSAFNYVAEKTQAAVEFVADKVNAVTLAVVGTATALAHSAFGTASAADTVTLPDMPVDFAELATKGMVVVGTVLVSIAGIVIVIALVYMGLRKLSSAFSGKA